MNAPHASDPTPTLFIDAPSQRYPVYLGHGLLATLGSLLQPWTRAERVLLISDDHVAPLYLQAAQDALEAADFKVATHIVPAGEASKRFEELTSIYEACAEHEIRRGDLLFALGGGMISDLVGFAAATWLRGVSFATAPTSVLAQVDASVGGKTGIDTPWGKNLVGSFKQPVAVFVDLDTLKTLPDRELASGMAEVMKYGLILDPELWDALLAMDPSLPPAWVIQRCIELKAQVVAEDELDHGRRQILNFGHSYGHAIEKLEGFGAWTHGEAVGVGMLIALRLSTRLCGTDPRLHDQLQAWLERWQLPTTTAQTPSDLLEAMRGDKKSSSHSLGFILTPEVGQAKVHPISFEALEALAPYLLPPSGEPTPLAPLVVGPRYVPPMTLSGSVQPPWSKSILHRLLIAAYLTGDPAWEQRVWPHLTAEQERTLSDDIRVTHEALRRFEAYLQDPSPSAPTQIACGESGTSLRLLVPLAASLGIEAVFHGRGRLGSRPLGELLEQLTAHGITATQLSETPSEYLPLHIRGQLQPGDYTLPGHVSSQYISGLMFALSHLDGPSTLTLTTPLASAPYVTLTQDVLAHYDVALEAEARADGLWHYRFPGQETFSQSAGFLAPEADYSQAAFWLVAQFLGSKLSVEGLNPRSRQGDRAVCDILERFEAQQRAPQLSEPLIVDATMIPDIVPILSIAATRVPGTVIFTGADRLRGKESDRLEASLMILHALGASQSYGTEDELIVPDEVPVWDTDPSFPLDCYSDHRIAMTLAIVAVHSTRGLTLRGSHCVAKSYPDFFEVLDRLNQGGLS